MLGLHIADFSSHSCFHQAREIRNSRQRLESTINFGSRLADATSLCNPLVHEILPQSYDIAPDASARTSRCAPLRRSPAVWPTVERRRLVSRRSASRMACDPAGGRKGAAIYARRGRTDPLIDHQLITTEVGIGVQTDARGRERLLGC